MIIMSSFNYDKKNEHEQLAKKAISAGDSKLAFHHTCQAAMFTFLLAKGSNGKIAEQYLKNAQGLLGAAKRLKDIILTQTDNDGAAPKNPTESNSIFKTVERPDCKFSDVAGMDDVKSKFTELVISPMQHEEIARKYGLKRGGGVLLYGPPGTGKTFIARALAGELNASFYVIKSSDLISKWVGATEAQIAALFNEARQQPLAVIFIDEIDAIMPDRSKKDVQGHENRMVSALLNELDGYGAKEASNTLLFLGATNRPYSIDSAFLRPGRFDIKIEVGLPDFLSRKKIIELFFQKRGWELPGDLLDQVAQRTEGYNSADVDNLAQTVTAIAFRKEIEAKQKELNVSDTPDFANMFEEALQTIKSTVSEKDLQLIAEWGKENGVKK